MDFHWVAIALGDISWIALAFALGFFSRLIGLPPMVGFLATGFFLHSQGAVSGEMLQKLADLGITLLLFTVGLKLNLRTLARPQVWAVSCIHMIVIVVVFAAIIYGLVLAAVPFFSDLDLPRALLIAFALSFSSTVFVVKVLEERGEIASLHGRVAIGILIMQDIAAVIFLAISIGKLPTFWALALLLLIPGRHVLHHLLEKVGHGELLALYGLILALGGAGVFQLVGVKGDLGALILGLLIAPHAKSEEMAKTMMSFKDLFLLGFFLSIGLSGQPTLQTFIIAFVIAVFVVVKSALFFTLLVAFKMRARTSLLTTLNLTNYSEFGLIVGAIGVSNGWIGSEWLIVIALALAISFALSAVLNALADKIYDPYRNFWRRLQRSERMHDDRPFDTKGATIAVIGMGRVGAGAYDKMCDLFDEPIVGVDFDPITVASQQKTGRNVLLGDPSDADFWDRIVETHTIDLVLLALPQLNTSLSVLEHLQQSNFSGRVTACARYADEEAILREAGAETVFNIYTEAGAGFAAHVATQGRAG